MTNSLKILSWFLLPGLCLSGMVSGEENLPIQRLDWMIGQWTFVDAAVKSDYVETGTRNCDWALDGRYILCTGTGTNHRGKVRSYLFYLNFNHMEERFEITGLFGDWPRKNLYVAEVSEDNHTLRLKSWFWTNDGLTPNNQATISYNGDDQYVWRIRSGEPDPETGEIPVSYVDTVTRAD